MTKPGILYVVCGPPGCGKTTFLNEIKNDDEVVISRDEIRYSLLQPGDSYFSHETEVYEKFLYTITKNIKKGINVYADATHLDAKSRFSLLHGLRNRGCRPREINAIYFNVPLKICKQRNRERIFTKGYTPEDEVEKMYAAYDFPAFYEGFTNIWEVNSEGDVEQLIELRRC